MQEDRQGETDQEGRNNAAEVTTVHASVMGISGRCPVLGPIPRTGVITSHIRQEGWTTSGVNPWRLAALNDIYAFVVRP